MAIVFDAQGNLVDTEGRINFSPEGSDVLPPPIITPRAPVDIAAIESISHHFSPLYISILLESVLNLIDPAGAVSLDACSFLIMLYSH